MSHNLTQREDGSYEFVESTVHGDRAWHRLGLTVPDRMLSASETVKEGGPLDWTIEQSPLIVARVEKTATGWDAEKDEPVYEERIVPRMEEDGVTFMRAPNWKLNERSDTREQFAVVGKDWTPAQNADLAELIDAAAGADAVEAAFSLRGGRDVCWALRLGEFEAMPGDNLYTYGLLANSHDGTGSLIATPTETRGVCDNTRRMILDGAKRSGVLSNLSIRHSKNVLSKENIARLRAILSQSKDALAENAEQVAALVGRTLTDEELRTFFLEAYELSVGLPLAPSSDLPAGDARDAAEKKFEKAKDKFIVTTAGWLATFQGEQESLNSEPSAWLAYNAVSKWSDHERGGNRGDRAHRNLLGAGSRDKVKVYREALALV